MSMPARCLASGIRAFTFATRFRFPRRGRCGVARTAAEKRARFVIRPCFGVPELPANRSEIASARVPPVAGKQATTRKSRFFKLFRSYLTLFDFLASRDKFSVTWTLPSSATTPT
jgi:hypothetical protein